MCITAATTTAPQTPELWLFSSATGKLLARQSAPQVEVSIPGAAGGEEASDWDSALAVEPGLALLTTSHSHDVLGAVSLPQLTGTPR